MEKANKDEIVKARMQKIGKCVDGLLPNGYGFVVLAFKFGEGTGREMMYVSNSNRQDIVQAMKEWIKKTEDSFGNDTGKY